MKKILAAVMTAALIFTLSGCGSSGTTNTSATGSNSSKDSEDAIQIVASGAYVSDLYGGNGSEPDPIGNVYCEYKNVSDKPITITSFDASFMDASGTVLDSGYTIYAPKTLNPGETGFDGAMRFSGSGLTMDVQPTVSFKPEYKTAGTVDNPLKAESVAIVSTSGYGGDVNNQIVQVTVSNSSSEEVSSFTIVVGLFDADGNLIGVAKQSMGSNPIPANGKAIEDCDDLVLQSDDLSTVVTMEAKVDATSAY